MGIYDTFLMEAPCWNCGEILEDWQTKQLDPCMMVYREGDRIHGINIIEGTVGVYGCCKCNAWNSATVLIKNGVVDSIEVSGGHMLRQK